MITFNVKPLLIALSLSCISTHAWALLSSDKLVVDSVNGDNITATVSFPYPVEGDLYLATVIGDQLYFLGQDGSLSTTVMPFQENDRFNEDRVVLDMPSAGIVPGVYPLFQVVTPHGAEPLDPDNWIGGLSGLEFSINLNNAGDTTDSTPTTDQSNGHFCRVDFTANDVPGFISVSGDEIANCVYTEGSGG
jgi:hypothetical protein